MNKNKAKLKFYPNFFEIIEQGDYVIRRRLVQKMDFIAEGLVFDQSALRDDAIMDHYLAHLAQYTQPATISFAHVFYSASKHGVAVAAAKAAAEAAAAAEREAAAREAAPAADTGLLFPANGRLKF